MCFRFIFVFVRLRDIRFLGEMHSCDNDALQKLISELRSDCGVSTGSDDVRHL
jgi:hypothetical protein